MSKFSFSICVYSKFFKDITGWGGAEEKYGFFKINDVNAVYDYKTGIKAFKFEDTNFI
jgi:hypothetical protein